MTPQRKQLIVGLIFSGTALLGLLAADGFFSRSWTVRSALRGPTQQMSDFGPPTRTLPPIEKDGATLRPVVADPLYVDVRVPTFYDQATVKVQFLSRPDFDGGDVRIGVEMGEGSGDIRFFETKNIVVGQPALGVEGTVPFEADIPLGEVLTPGNRLRVVLSITGASPERPVSIVGFSVAARRSSNVVRAMLNRLGL